MLRFDYILVTESGNVHPLPRDDTFVIGRGSTNDLVVYGEMMGRRHVALSATEEGVRISDLGSPNGTYYRGERIDGVFVTPPDEFRTVGLTWRIVTLDWLARHPPPPFANVDLDVPGGRLRTRDGAAVSSDYLHKLYDAFRTTRFSPDGDSFDPWLRSVHIELDGDSADDFWVRRYLGWREAGGVDEWVLHAIAFLCSPRLLRTLSEGLDDPMDWFLGRRELVIDAIARSVHGHGRLLAFWRATSAESLHDVVYAREMLAALAAPRGVAWYVADGLPDDSSPEVTEMAARVFEEAMATGVSWTTDEWRSLTARKSVAPLLGGIVFRHVADEATLAFRLVGGELLTASDEVLELPPDGRITVAHPAAMNESERREWADYLAHNQIAEPFEQLARNVYRPGDALPPLSGYPLGGVCVRRGWEREYLSFEPAVIRMSRHFRSWGVVANAEFIYSDDVHYLDSFYFQDASRRASRVPSSSVSTIAYSEALRDLALIFADDFDD